MWTVVATWLVVGTALPAFCGWAWGIRDTTKVLVHDEHCYLLQADTFARGRMTNPSPRHPEFFESPYIFLEPSYQAKYPPGQAIFLAIGQRFLGHPIYGVWLTCGLFTAGLYWMLSGWTNRQWAVLGTVHAVIVLGIITYWARSYWGGMVAAWGGAMVLGGTRWTIRRWTPGYGLLTGLGTVILANSRPYEGGVVCLACAPVMAWWLLGGSSRERRRKLIGWCGPFALVVAAGSIGMAAYNQAVTGSWKALPYTLHPQQYFTCGMFRWQPIDQVPERRLTTRVRLLYEEYGLLNPGKPGGPQLGAIAVYYSLRQAFLDLFQNFITPTKLVPPNETRDSSTVGPSLLVIFLAMTAWFLCTTKRWGVLHAAWSLIILEVLAGGAVWWNLPHYQAPIVCLVYFLVVDGVRRVALSCRGTWLPRSVRPRHMILIFSLLIPPVLLGSQLLKAVPYLGTPPAKAAVSDPGLPSSYTALTRPQLLKLLTRQERSALAFVSYDPAVPIYQEWVYNLADLESQRVVLAHDLGPKRNSLLIADFPSRDAWRVHVTPKGAMLQRYDDAIPLAPDLR
jgi:hypothetical protein